MTLRFTIKFVQYPVLLAEIGRQQRYLTQRQKALPLDLQIGEFRYRPLQTFKPAQPAVLLVPLLLKSTSPKLRFSQSILEILPFSRSKTGLAKLLF